MEEQSLDKILQDFQNNAISIDSLLNYFFSIIEDSDDEELRISYILSFKNIIPLLKLTIKHKIYMFLEQLLVSDNQSSIKCSVISVLLSCFKKKAFNLFTWSLHHETDYYCIVALLKALAQIKSRESRKILLQELEKIQKNSFINKRKQIDNKKYKHELKLLFEKKIIFSLSHVELADILINFHTIKNLKEKFYTVYFELEKGNVIELDLSDVEYEVRGWKPEFKNNITSLLEITGLENLKNLRRLDLSNNQLRDIRELMGLKKITHLMLANNKIENAEDIACLNKMENLKYLEIIGNKIADKQFIQEFNPHVEILLKREWN